MVVSTESDKVSDVSWERESVGIDVDVEDSVTGDVGWLCLWATSDLLIGREFA